MQPLIQLPAHPQRVGGEIAATEGPAGIRTQARPGKVSAWGPSASSPFLLPHPHPRSPTGQAGSWEEGEGQACSTLR